VGQAVVIAIELRGPVGGVAVQVAGVGPDGADQVGNVGQFVGGPVRGAGETPGDGVDDGGVG